MKIFRNACVFSGNGFTKKDIAVENGLFAEPYSGEEIDLSGKKIIPGLVDTHSHGNSGADFSDGDYDGLKTMAAFYASNGVTSFAPTSMTLPYDTLEKAFSTAVRYCNEYDGSASRIAGIHMEGPYFSYRKRGAQNADYLKNPDYDGFFDLYNRCGGLIKTVDIAPELPGAVEFTEKVCGQCIVGVAHTDASYTDAKNVFDAGASRLVHLFNAMPGIHHRNPGVIGAASENGNVTAELICDGLHVSPSAVRMAFKLFPGRLCLISDSLRCAGMPDGTYQLGGQDVILKNNEARLTEGNLAGSVANLFACMKNAIEFGINESDAINAATVIPAASIGMDKVIGSIENGKFADFLVCDENLNLEQVYIGGIKCR